MTEQQKTKLQSWHDMLTLLIAWQSARYTGRHQGGAIRKCARKLRRETKDKDFYVTMDKLVKGDDSGCVASLEKCMDGLREIGAIS